MAQVQQPGMGMPMQQQPGILSDILDPKASILVS